ncbi:MAG TPA: sensor domain-containing diguanylate cyclase [Vicinamibacterales bacterium]|nr:sensor domain-containing diguanylate cyclase [Vicinamibacterales bacterium]
MTLTVPLTPLSAEQLELLWRSCAEAAAEHSVDAACRRLADGMAQVIKAPVAVFRREYTPWTLVIDAGSRGAHPVPAPGAIDVGGGPQSSRARVRRLEGPEECTAIHLATEGTTEWLMTLPGDWLQPQFSWLPRLVDTALLALKVVRSRERVQRSENLATVSFAIARKIGQISDEHALQQFVVDAAARIARAGRATLAAFRTKDGKLEMVATYGYPREQVEHVRVSPGSGVIGGVFTSRKPVLVRDLTRMPWVPARRKRYKTDSFIAVPLLAGSDVLGVLTLADRTDGAPFDRADLLAVRIIAAPAALALSRHRLAEHSEELAHLAAIDPLTGLFNRRYLQTRLTAELERARRSRSDLALMMVDVDRFKSINDQHGHAAGDAVLQQVADIIRRSVRLSDVCTRYGGDEFAVLVPESAGTAVQSAERIRQRVQEFGWPSVVAGAGVQPTVSIGIAMAEPTETASDFSARADRLLYRAKADGRNIVRSSE